MYTVTARFLPALAESHTVASEVALFRSDGGVELLPHTGGSVTVDRKAVSRRTCTVEIADPSLIPRSAADKLSIYGATLRISAGVQLGAYREMVPVGVFRLDSVAGDPDLGPVTLGGKSMEAAVADHRFAAVTRVSGTAVGAVTQLIQETLPTATVVTAAGVVDAAIGPRTYDIQGDRWAAVTECAAAIGAEVYCDPDGIFTIAVLPDPLSTAPAWTIAAGEGGALVSASRGMNADGVYNGVLATGENTETGTAAVSAFVVDNDPTSPTYWGGPFGKRPYFYASATLTSTALATQAATLKLRQVVAPNSVADITSLPNPALEPGDVIRVVYLDGSQELHQVAGFTVPLTEGGDFAVSTISAQDDS